MFSFHMAFSLGLIALAAGSGVYLLSVAKPESTGKTFAKVISFLIIIFSITSTLCTVYYGVKYWKAGNYEMPHQCSACMTNQKDMMMQQQPMQNMMQQNNQQPQ